MAINFNQSRSPLGGIVILGLLVAIATGGVASVIFNNQQQGIYQQGYAQGYLDGWSSGNSTGWIAGNATSWDSGNSTGWIAGNSSGFSQGYNEGWLAGWDAGFSAGYQQYRLDHYRESGMITPMIDGVVNSADNWTNASVYNMPFMIYPNTTPTGDAGQDAYYANDIVSYNYVSLGQDANNIYALIDMVSKQTTLATDHQIVTFGFTTTNDSFGSTSTMLASNYQNERQILTVYNGGSGVFKTFNFTLNNPILAGMLVGTSAVFPVYNDTVNWANLSIGETDMLPEGLSYWNNTYTTIIDKVTHGTGGGGPPMYFAYQELATDHYEPTPINMTCINIDVNLSQAFPYIPAQYMDAVMHQLSDVLVNITIDNYDAEQMDSGQYLVNGTDHLRSYLNYETNGQQEIPLWGGPASSLAPGHQLDPAPNLQFSLPTSVVQNGHLKFNITTYSHNATLAFLTTLGYLQLTLPFAVDWHTYFAINSTITDYTFARGFGSSMNNATAHVIYELRVGKDNFPSFNANIGFYVAGIDEIFSIGNLYYSQEISMSWCAFSYPYDIMLNSALPALQFTIVRSMPDFRCAYTNINLDQVRKYWV